MSQIKHELSERPVYKTRDYSLFFFDEVNRPVEPSRVAEMVKSIRFKNFLSIVPITVKEVGNRLLITNGQNRFSAAKILQVDIYYSIHDEFDIQDGARIDLTHKLWSKADNLHLWSARKYPEYLALKQFLREFPWMTLNRAAAFSSTQSSHGNFNLVFSQGLYVADNLEGAARIANMLLDFKAYVSFYNERAFVATIRGLADDPNYHHDRMMKKMKSQHRKLVPQANADGYYEVLNTIYNYREAKDRWVHFWREKPAKRDKKGRFAAAPPPVEEEEDE